MPFRYSLVLVLSLVGVAGFAQPARAATTFDVTAQGMSKYVIDGAINPTLTLTRGQTYTFNISVSVAMPHPFWITTALGGSDVNANAYSLGVTNNGASPGVVTFTVPASAPATLYYQCSFHDPMAGELKIVSAPPVTSVAAPAVGTVALLALACLLLLASVMLLGKRRQLT